MYDIFGKVQLKEWTAALVKEFSLALKKVGIFCLATSSEIHIYVSFETNDFEDHIELWEIIVLPLGGGETWT